MDTNAGRTAVINSCGGLHWKWGGGEGAGAGGGGGGGGEVARRHGG